MAARGKPTADEAITLPEMKSALQRSGYLLEDRVERVLRRRGHYTVRNPAFRDPISEKTREIDFIVHMAQRVRSRPKEVWVFPDVFLECQNNNQPVAFFETREPPIVYMRLSGIQLSGEPVQVTCGKTKRKMGIAEYLGFDRFHHYGKGPAATQYCSFRKRRSGKGWLALHEDEHHSALLGLISAVEAEKQKDQQHLASTYPDEPRFSLSLCYPVLVLQGDMYVAKVKREAHISLRSRKKFLFRKEHLWNHAPESYYIDVVTESQLPRLMGPSRRRPRRPLDESSGAGKRLSAHWAAEFTSPAL